MVGCITNSALSEVQWLQTSLPINYGGLRVRIVIYLACSFSLFGILIPQEQILATCTSATDEQYLSSWLASFGAPAYPLPGKQFLCDKPTIQADHSLANILFVEPSRGYLASMSLHTGDWLFALLMLILLRPQARRRGSTGSSQCEAWHQLIASYCRWPLNISVLSLLRPCRLLEHTAYPPSLARK